MGDDLYRGHDQSAPLHAHQGEAQVRTALARGCGPRRQDHPHPAEGSGGEIRRPLQVGRGNHQPHRRQTLSGDHRCQCTGTVLWPQHPAGGRQPQRRNVQRGAAEGQRICRHRRHEGTQGHALPARNLCHQEQGTGRALQAHATQWHAALWSSRMRQDVLRRKIRRRDGLQLPHGQDLRPGEHLHPRFAGEDRQSLQAGTGKSTVCAVLRRV